MAKIKGANAVLDVMYKWGIDHLYGFPGGSFDSTMNAIYEMQDKIKFIEVRHEEAGAWQSQQNTSLLVSLVSAWVQLALVPST